jgi:hypothetical protein
MHMEKKWNERDHIKSVGEGAFEQLRVRAIVLLKDDGRLVGADKLRTAFAHEVALRATGAPVRVFVPPSGWNTGAIDCDELIESAAERLEKGPF